MMTTMRNIEDDSIPKDFEGMKVFATFTGDNATRILEAEITKGATSMSRLPSFKLAMDQMDMRHEIMHLMSSTVTPESVDMTKSEAQIMNSGQLWEDAVIPGVDGPGKFVSSFLSLAIP